MLRSLGRVTLPLLLGLTFLVSMLAVMPVWGENVEGGNSVVILEDFDDMVTAVDLGFDDFSGNMGVINDEYIVSGQVLVCSGQAPPCARRFRWDFGLDEEVFTGLFFSLFGLTETKTRFGGSITQTEIISFPEHSLDLDRLDGLLDEPGGPRSFTEVCTELTYEQGAPVDLRVELKDVTGSGRFTRLTIPASPSNQIHCWDFRQTYTALENDLDIHQAKEFDFIIERNNIGAGINNPITGTIDFHQIWFSLAEGEIQPSDEQALLDLQERRAYQYFLDWSSRKPDSRGIPQDRSTFGDLLTVGGVGFALPAHIIAAEKGWISRTTAVSLTLDILRTMDNSDAFGPDAIGKIGYKGWFYHFLGVDGRRKLNFDFEATPTNEALNTVELSTIDTGLALMGVLAAQSYFTDIGEPLEKEIMTRTQSIYERVEWPFMLETSVPESPQFYLGWKPLEEHDAFPPFTITDTEALGHYSGITANPDTLDFYTDEALIVILLALGSPTHPVSPTVYNALAWDWYEHKLVRTYPGTLFTYQFLHAFIDTGHMPACPLFPNQINWFANSREAISQTIQYATENPANYATYGPDAWGISAAEGPTDAYHAYGAPPVAVSLAPEEDGTITYYGMMSAVSFGEDLRQQSISALQAAWDRGHWQPRFGLPDAFHTEISQVNLPTNTLRSQGPWQQQARFAIDQGPMLLHLANARSGIIWDLLAGNENIQRAWSRLYSHILVPKEMVLEAEAGDSEGEIQMRSNASGEQTVWLQAGETLTVSFSSQTAVRHSFHVRYSNDNFGPLEEVNISVDGQPLGSFIAQDTGDGGAGWNVFDLSGHVGAASVMSGTHVVTISIVPNTGDSNGVEIDMVELSYVDEVFCKEGFLPLVRKD